MYVIEPGLLRFVVPLGYPEGRAPQWAGRQLLSTVCGGDNSAPMTTTTTGPTIAHYDIETNPAWYSFGVVIVALRYLPESQE